MAVDYTTAALLASIRRRAMVPASDEALTDTDLLALTNEELQSFIVPLLLSTCEEYLVTSKDLTIVAGTAGYEIPSRAVGGKLRDVQLLINDRYVSLPRIEPEFASDYEAEGDPQFFYLNANQVVLVPEPQGSGTLRLVYYRRPSSLVASGFTTLSSTIDLAGGSYAGTVADYTQVDGQHFFDIVLAQPPFSVLGDGFNGEVGVDEGLVVIGTGQADAASIAATVSAAINRPIFPDTYPYVCIAGESPVPQIPVELHPLLAQRVAVRVLEALGDDRLKSAKVLCDEVKVEALKMLVPRAEGTGRTIINRNGPGFRRQSRWRT